MDDAGPNIVHGVQFRQSTANPGKYAFQSAGPIQANRLGQPPPAAHNPSKGERPKQVTVAQPTGTTKLIKD